MMMNLSIYKKDIFLQTDKNKNVDNDIYLYKL